MNDDFDDVIKSIKVGSTIDFVEYSIDRHERKHESVRIENAIVRDIFPANHVVDIDRITEIYSEDVSDDERRALTISGSTRILVSLGTDEYGNDMVKMLNLVDYFYKVGQQEIVVHSKYYDKNSSKKLHISEEPNYTEAMKFFNEM